MATGLPNNSEKQNETFNSNPPLNYPPQQPGLPPLKQPGNPPPPPQQQQPGYPPQNEGYPPPSYSPQGYPSQDNPPLGYPSQGYSPQGYPPQGYPPQSYPPQPPVGMQQQQQSTNTTVIIQNQPQAQVVTAVVPIVHDYLGLSIFACFCCFCPLGVVAIFKSIESRDRYTAGDYAGATNSARTALTLAKISIALGIIIYIISIVVRSV